jgi:hypothetical protein
MGMRMGGMIDRNTGHDDDEVFGEFYGLGDCVASYECRPWGAGISDAALPLFLVFFLFSSSLYIFFCLR